MRKNSDRMGSKIHLHIPEPCREDWSIMPKTERGKYCAACSKEVFDFSNLSPYEINRKFLEFHQNQTDVCGQFKNSQLRSIGRDSAPSIRQLHGFRRFVFPIAALVSWFITSCKSRTSGVPMTEPYQGDHDQVRIFNQLCNTRGRTAGSIVIDDRDTIKVDSTSLNKKLFCKVNFNHDEFRLTHLSIKKLDTFIKELASTNYVEIEIIGHTDTTGSMQYNKALSEKRAKSVSDHLRSQGVKVTAARGVGFQYPVSSNASMVGRADNRRVEIRVKTEETKK